MDRAVILAVLEDMRSNTLRSKKQFTKGYQLRDQWGWPLPPIADSMNQAVYVCVTGAALKSLHNVLQYEIPNMSDEHFDIIRELTSTIGLLGTRGQQFFKLRKFSNEKDYEAVRELINKTIDRLIDVDAR